MLPEEASFCPHCATDIHPRKQAKTATPLLKKLLLGLLALAVLAAECIKMARDARFGNYTEEYQWN